jgi:hypothetical protein
VLELRTILGPWSPNTGLVVEKRRRLLRPHGFQTHLAFPTFSHPPVRSARILLRVLRESAACYGYASSVNEKRTGITHCWVSLSRCSDAGPTLLLKWKLLKRQGSTAVAEQALRTVRPPPPPESSGVWKSIPATPISKLSDEQLREIELEENIRREGLDSYEASAQRMKEIRVIEAELAEEVLRHDDAKVSGRPKGGDRETARRLGVDKNTVTRAKKHVGMVDRFPSMKHKDWNQGLVLAAEELGAPTTLRRKAG